jgi:phage terminase small subunit
LTRKEELFVRYYLCRLNGTQSALKAGFRTTPRSAAVYATRLLAKANVSAAVEHAIDARKKRLETTGDNILLELTRVALSDMRRLVDEHGQLIPISELDDDAAAMVSSIEVGRTSLRRGREGNKRTREQVTKVKLWDKTKALGLACRHLMLVGKDAGQPPPYQGPAFILPPGTKVASHLEWERAKVDAEERTEFPVFMRTSMRSAPETFAGRMTTDKCRARETVDDVRDRKHSRPPITGRSRSIL